MYFPAYYTFWLVEVSYDYVTIARLEEVYET